MNPHDLGFPKNKFNEFRPAQLEAFQYVLTSDKRVSMIGAPTGVGKSGIAYGIARLLGGRVNILTANTGLEDQYVNDGFEGLVNVRGQANYECWEGGTCADGKRLGCGDRDSCPYSVAREVADYSEIVVQNYAYWLQSGAQQRPFETLI